MESVYDIEAKADADALKGLCPKDRADKLWLMLQALLVQRFKLTIRRDVREQPVCLLTVGKSGPKLQKSKLQEKDCEDLRISVTSVAPARVVWLTRRHSTWQNWPSPFRILPIAPDRPNRPDGPLRHRYGRLGADAPETGAA
jgi:uncharacterized protein (TIGR03435 family)